MKSQVGPVAGRRCDDGSSGTDGRMEIFGRAGDGGDEPANHSAFREL